MYLLSGDVGGTNTRLVLFEASGSALNPFFSQTYNSQSFDTFTDVLRVFLSDSGCTESIKNAAIGIAGPTRGGNALVTNLSWQISESSLMDEFHFKSVKLVNDFVAISYGVSELQSRDIKVIQQGEVPENAENTSAVILGAGTGLGLSTRLCINQQYHVFPTESGHSGFAPESRLQSKLLLQLQSLNKHVSLEDILSGRGFLLIYQFLKVELKLTTALDLTDQFVINDPALIITDLALSDQDTLCVETLKLFIEIYGAAAGNLVLNHYPIDEVYIAGGIAPKIKLDKYKDIFLKAFHNKGLMTPNMKNLPIKMVVQEKVGLMGAARLASMFL